MDPHARLVDSPRVGDIWFCTQVGNESIWYMALASWTRWDAVGVPVVHPNPDLFRYGLVLSGAMERSHQGLSWVPSSNKNAVGRPLALQLGTGDDVARYFYFILFLSLSFKML